LLHSECSKRKSVRIRYAKSEEGVRILVKGKTGVRFELILVVTTGAQQQEVEPIDQAFIEYLKRSKEKAVKVNRLGSPSQEGRSVPESRARPV
jgi:hypothetical protein